LKNEQNNWHESNQRYLMAALAVVREALERHAQKNTEEQSGAGSEDSSASYAMQEAAAEMSTPPALHTLCETFGLSAFERNVLLMCAGIELDSSFAAFCKATQNGQARSDSASFGLALAAFPEAHWSALSPAAPLRRWRLIEISDVNALTTGPLRIDERVLHYLVGVQHIDERLAGIIEPMKKVPALVPSQQKLAEQIAALWCSHTQSAPPPVVQLCGDETTSKRAVAATACRLLNLNLVVASAQSIPHSPSELSALTRLWEREAALSGCALLLDCGDIDATDASRARAISYLLDHVDSPFIVASRDRGRTPASTHTLVTFDVPRPSASEQRDLWLKTLDKVAVPLNGAVESLLSQFNLSAQAIEAASVEALGNLALAETHNVLAETHDVAAHDEELATLLWDACRVQARPGLDDLAQRLEPAAARDDLVLPEAQHQVLREIVAHVRHRSVVYEKWRFADKGTRGLGISALFAGASGTGKTMAAEMLASELRLDLYRIDLSAVVSKYIGETEKNLRRVFDAAEDGGAILLFDEADALFGKRSEVKDSHDRYANIEISYLLQRMEAYRGLVILTTNMRSALDTAFLRRIRFVVPFPFPDAEQRAEIWRRIFPAQMPTEGLDFDLLAKLNVPGGNIRNIALHAAFLAADEGASVCMSHLLRATRNEYAKIEKPLTDSEIKGWI
jgi:hypothetical protein